ncbi:SAM-dependent methyltransferase [Blastococcus saxobsidens]|uniref:Putative S-adenosyl-L-methionine-dependent methyltransferases family n=1 Tax=Blastococcus saxobsidens (strain DD2) TaxID=1146883 RepID=H6RW34_BLASD|nr:SAM-dependent methyltransferase [Blastococcus saxobsidens]CCG02051.1 putative S-adenosyl-L-methionine-dependent methyltransferases family [Blastococcus saxobsidens DD2]
MSARFEELDWAATPIGEVSLRRRRAPDGDVDIFEVKLGDEFLMSSLFTVAEIEVARLALARLDGPALEVAVGGLGLGYTAQAVLSDSRVSELVVVDLLEPVIGWHRRGLVPVGPVLTADPRCRLAHGDFFAMSDGAGFDPQAPARAFDAVIVDIDHSPRHLLAGDDAGFYGADGTRRLARHLRPGGVFSLWSNDPPDDGYLAVLSDVFVDVAAEVVTFDNPLQDRPATNTVYLATRPA